MLVRFGLDDVRTITHYLGVLIIGVAAAMIVPLITAVGLQEWGPALDYVLGIGICGTIGAAAMLAQTGAVGIDRRQALVVTALVWIVAAAAAAIPLTLSGNYGSYLDALFETVSGFTTSGLTLTQNMDHMANSHNMWRHLTHLIGGQGIIVAALSFAFARREGVFALYVAEGRDERILPNVMYTARFIWFVAALYVLLGTLSLGISMMWLGVSPVRSGLQAFFLTAAAFDTGGFGPQSQNILYYHSGIIETILMMLMMAGSLNFNLHADLFAGDFREMRQNIEVRTLAVNIIILVAFAATGMVVYGVLGSGAEVWRKGVFHIISAHSGAGHQTVYAPQWITALGGGAFAAVILAMAAGGAVSSTAGGIKALRLGLIAKSIWLNIKRALSPDTAVVNEHYHHIVDRRLTEQMISAALTVFVLYTVTYISGGLAGAAYGYPAGDAIFESVSATANVGLSTGITSPDMPAGLKIVYILQMWAGRLEFMALFVLGASIVISVLPERRRR